MISADGVGYVVFVQNDCDGDTDKKQHCHYHDKVFLPFVVESHKKYDPGWQEGDEITESMRGHCWQDGDIAQIQALVEEETIEQFNALKIDASKQNASRTGTEQAADLSAVFMLMNDLQKTTTCEDIDADLLPIKQTITNIFDGLTRDGILQDLGKKNQH